MNYLIDQAGSGGNCPLFTREFPPLPPESWNLNLTYRLILACVDAKIVRKEWESA